MTLSQFIILLLISVGLAIGLSWHWLWWLIGAAVIWVIWRLSRG
ncbi:hypothetical protein OMCYN_00801 [cyanobiont of Ornithocercus magnificus]|nr:hypothetical protein OMCYN_00801 [cyanobiont of Ornithocercus magnificus]